MRKKKFLLKTTAQLDANVPGEHPPEFRRSGYEKTFDLIEKMKGNLNENLEKFLKAKFKASSMNICQTQPLSMMNVPKMTVEFKEESKKIKAKRTSRIIPVPLAMRKRSAEHTLDTNRMASAVPVPEEGKEIFFSCLDA